MGLDMWLFRSMRVPGLTEEDYCKAGEAAFKGGATGSLQGAREQVLGVCPALAFAVTQHADDWYSIMEHAAYWRQANAIHQWFCDKVRDGVDEAQLSEVSKAQLEDLLATIKAVLKDPRPRRARRLLPTQDGCGFGATDYDDGYLAELKYTEETLERVLAETDFEKQIVFYDSWW